MHDLATLPFAAALCACLAAQTPQTAFAYEMLTDNSIAVGSAMAFAPDGRLFVCERTTGNIRIVSNGALLQAPWATVPVYSNLASEQGLLGIAIDPAFLQNGFVYVYYSTTDQMENRIARLRDASGVGTDFCDLTPDNAIPTGGSTIHHGGRLVFGQDGKLYAGTGDRVLPATAPSLSSWNGKVLRFDVPNLAIPSDNPFPGQPYFSIGHRNQFGLTVHPRTGDLFQTEVGDSTTDELNRIVAGGNYGWPTYEGPEPVPDPATVDPLAYYSPTPDPTGTCFYSGANYPDDYAENWFFVEYTNGLVRRLVLDATATAVSSQSVFDDLVQAYDIQMGPDGNLWVLHNDTRGARGGDEIGRYVHPNEPSPSLNLMAVSNKSVGGAITFGVHGQNGDLFVPWISGTRFAPPVSTPCGDQWVPLEMVLSFVVVTGDDRAYLGVPVPFDLAFLGVEIHAQAARVDARLQVAATNFDSLVLR